MGRKMGQGRACCRLGGQAVLHWQGEEERALVKETMWMEVSGNKAEGRGGEGRGGEERKGKWKNAWSVIGD